MRRPKGEGSITQLPNGKFRVRLETDPVNGKRHWKTATVTTRKEAVKKLRELETLKDNYKTLQDNSKDVQAYIERYLAFRRLEGIRDTTLQVLRYTLNSLGEFLIDLDVSTVTKRHLMEYMSSQRAAGISDSTLTNKLNNIKVFFDYLKDELKVIENNPATSIKIKKTTPPKERLEVLSDTEHKRLKEVMEDDFFTFLTENNKWSLKYRMYPLYLLTYETGLRESEVAGLKWSKVNFKDESITVSSKISVIITKGVQDTPPKTYSGYRTVKVSHKTMKVLQELKEAYEDKKFTSEYVFGNQKTHGKAFCPLSLLRAFQQALKDAGIDRHFTFHGIRHTNSSIMFNEGVSPAVIAERLGHANIHTLLKVYTHALQDDKDRNRPLVEA